MPARGALGRRFLAPVFLGVALMAGCGGDGEGAPRGEAGPEPGALVVIGGGLSAGNEAVYRAILEAREGDGALCVIPTAGADPGASARSAVERFDRWGGEGTARALLLSLEAPEAAHAEETARSLAGCSGFFFTGGVQSRILEFFRPEGQETEAYRALMARWREGAVVSGSSAGAAMMSEPMISGGPPAGRFAAEGAEGGGVQLAPGMAFLPELLVDQHFLARGRIGRLVEALGRPETPPLAAGVDEDTALLVRNGAMEVVGSSGVIVLDARPGAMGGGSEGGVRVELLGPGDRMALEAGSPVEPGAGKVALGGGDGDPAGSAISSGPELFERWVFLHRIEAVAAGLTGTAAEGERPGFRLVPGPGFRALAWEDGAGQGADESTSGLSVGPFLLQVDGER